MHNDREAERTLAHVVRQSFSEGEVIISEDNAKYVRILHSLSLHNMLRQKQCFRNAKAL